MRSEQMKRVVIVGGGTAGWMAAAALSKILKNSGTEIVLIESDDIGAVGVGEATVPAINAFNAFLGLDRDDFMRQCQATYKLGIEFVNWGALGRRYMHPFMSYGIDAGRQQFPRLFLKYALAQEAGGKKASIDDFNLGALAARAGKVGWPSPDRSEQPLTYAFHFDAALYARHLRKYAEAHGVQRREGKITTVQQDSESGNILSVSLHASSDVEGDFFIDCSGFAGLLIEQTLRTGYDDWSQWLPCNRAIAVPSEISEVPVPYTRATADAAGWMWRIPLQSRVGNGYVYCSNFIEDDKAETRLMAQLDGAPLDQPRKLRFTTGRRRKAWNRNCVALGLAAGFIEPLESTSIHLIQTSLFRLIGLFPGAKIEPAEVAAFNRQTAEEYENIRDFIIAHYKVTERSDQPFWRYCRDMKIPARLEDTISLFSARGRLAMPPEQLFTVQSWFALLYGQGELPRCADPLLSPLEPQPLRTEMARIGDLLRSTVEALPSHARVLEMLATGSGCRR